MALVNLRWSVPVAVVANAKPSESNVISSKSGEHDTAILSDNTIGLTDITGSIVVVTHNIQKPSCRRTLDM